MPAVPTERNRASLTAGPLAPQQILGAKRGAKKASQSAMHGTFGRLSSQVNALLGHIQPIVAPGKLCFASRMSRVLVSPAPSAIKPMFYPVLVVASGTEATVTVGLALQIGPTEASSGNLCAWPHDWEVAPVRGHIGQLEPLGYSDDRRVHRTERKVGVGAHEAGHAGKILRGDGDVFELARDDGQGRRSRGVLQPLADDLVVPFGQIAVA